MLERGVAIVQAGSIKMSLLDSHHRKRRGPDIRRSHPLPYKEIDTNVKYRTPFLVRL
ncbi:hypothetical protein CUJ84_Chr000815 [Rhizobium leguminosarum]|uniref:Uncharacterized protein n=1 Tax=Rhizobium leguminosarum TaxID=384 RepID=A0A2K9YYZ6_RHILE|nr:hypothetical protein CUJ84_Chr000815 [Rhizobium leguminosarum]